MDTHTVAGLQLGFFQPNFLAKFSHILLNRNLNLRPQTMMPLPTEQLWKNMSRQKICESFKHRKIFPLQQKR